MVLEWHRTYFTYSSDMKADQIEALREIAEQLDRLNTNVEKIMEDELKDQ